MTNHRVTISFTESDLDPFFESVPENEEFWTGEMRSLADEHGYNLADIQVTCSLFDPSVAFGE